MVEGKGTDTAFTVVWTLGGQTGGIASVLRGLTGGDVDAVEVDTEGFVF